MSGKRFDRPEFLKMLDIARSGDVIVVWRLDRLGRSPKQLIAPVVEIHHVDDVDHADDGRNELLPLPRTPSIEHWQTSNTDTSYSIK